MGVSTICLCLIIPPFLPLASGHQQIYLLNVGQPLPDGRRTVTEYNYVEERSQGDSVCYAHTVKERLDDGHEAEVRVVVCMVVAMVVVVIANRGVCVAFDPHS